MLWCIDPICMTCCKSSNRWSSRPTTSSLVVSRAPIKILRCTSTLATIRRPSERSIHRPPRRSTAWLLPRALPSCPPAALPPTLRCPPRKRSLPHILRLPPQSTPVHMSIRPTWFSPDLALHPRVASSHGPRPLPLLAALMTNHRPLILPPLISEASMLVFNRHRRFLSYSRNRSFARLIYVCLCPH